MTADDELPDAASDKTRRIRTRVSAALLFVGTAAFFVSLALPAVRKLYGGSRMEVDGWTAATQYGPTAVGNSFLVLAFAFWGAAHWFRSIWAWMIGVALAVVATLHHGLIGAWPGFEEIERLHAGYYMWVGATAVVCLSFLVLLPPDRPPPGEPLPREDVRRGRVGFARILAITAVCALIAGHFLVPTTVASVWAPGPVPDRESSYHVGPFRTTGQSSFMTRTREDGTTEAIEYHLRPVESPVAAARFLVAKTGVLEFATLSLPLLLLAAWVTGRRAWRWTGAAVAATVGVAQAGWFGPPWSMSGFDPHPLAILWYATPALFVAAFLLIPSRPRPDPAPRVQRTG